MRYEEPVLELRDQEGSTQEKHTKSRWSVGGPDVLLGLRVLDTGAYLRTSGPAFEDRLERKVNSTKLKSDEGSVLSVMAPGGEEVTV